MTLQTSGTNTRHCTIISRSSASLVAFFLIGFGVPWAAAIAARLKHISNPYIMPAFMIAEAFCSVGGAIATYIEGGGLALKQLARRCALYRRAHRLVAVRTLLASRCPYRRHPNLRYCARQVRSDHAAGILPSAVAVLHLRIWHAPGSVGGGTWVAWLPAAAAIATISSPESEHTAGHHLGSVARRCAFPSLSCNRSLYGRRSCAQYPDDCDVPAHTRERSASHSYAWHGFTRQGDCASFLPRRCRAS